MRRWGRRYFSPRLKSGYASKAEEAFGKRLAALGVPASYETTKLKFKRPPPKDASYLADFQCPGFIIEFKGYFESADRTKHLLIKEQHPDVDIRFVFQCAKNTITKTSKTTYGQWAEKHGFKWADKDIPAEWIAEAKRNAKGTKNGKTIPRSIR